MKYLIVEDTQRHAVDLRGMLETHFPDLVCLGICNTVAKAVKAIEDKTPELVFLDVELGTESGFDLLEKIKPVSFQIIFTTAHSEYALRAIKHSALDFLLKPVDKDELITAVNKAGKANSDSGLLFLRKQVAVLLSHIGDKATDRYLIAKDIGNNYFFDYDDIVYIEADSNQVDIYMVPGSVHGAKVVISKTLKQIEAMLDPNHFTRVHKSSIVHLKYVRVLVAGLHRKVEMSNGKSIDVSDTYYQATKDALKRYHRKSGA